MMGEPGAGVRTERGGFHQRYGRPPGNKADSGRGKVAVGTGGNKFAAMRAMFERGAAGAGDAGSTPAPPPRRRTKDASMKRPDSWILRDKAAEPADRSCLTDTAAKMSSDRTVTQKTAFSRHKTPEMAGGSSRTDGDNRAAAEKLKLSSDRTVSQKTAFSRGKTAEDRLGSYTRVWTDGAPEPPERSFPRDSVLRKSAAPSAPTEDVETSKTYKAHRNLVNGVSEERKHSEMSSVSAPKVAREKFPDEPVPSVREGREKMAETENTSEIGHGRNLTEEVVFVEEVVTSEAESAPQRSSRVQVQPDVTDVPLSQLSTTSRDVADVPVSQESRTSRDVTDAQVSQESRTSRDVTDAQVSQESRTSRDVANAQVSRESRTSRRRRVGRHDAPDVNSYELHISENRTSERDLKSTTSETDITGTSAGDLRSRSDKAGISVENAAERETLTPAPRRHTATPRRDVNAVTSVRTDVTNGVDVQELVQTITSTQSRHNADGDVAKIVMNGTSTSTQRQSDVTPREGVDAETPARTDDIHGHDVSSENLIQRRRNVDVDVTLENSGEDTTRQQRRTVRETDDGEKSAENGVASTRRHSKAAGVDAEYTDKNETSTRQRSRITDVDVEKNDENGAPARRRSRVADADVEKLDDNGVTSTRRRSRIANVDVEKTDVNGAPTRRRSRIVADIDDVDAELARPRYRRRDRDTAVADLDAPRRRSRNGGDVMTSVTSARGRSTLLPEDGTLELNSAAYGKVGTLQWGFRAPGYADRLERRRPLERMNGDEMALRGALLSGDVDKIKVMVSTWPHKVLDFRNVYGQSGISTLHNGHVTKDQSEEVVVFPKRPIEYSNPAVSWSREVTKAVVEGLTAKSDSGFQAVCMQNVLPDKDMTNDFATAALEADSQDSKMEGTLDVYLNVWLKWGYSNSEKLAKTLAAGWGAAARMRLHASSAVVHRAHRCYKFVGELINTLDPEVTTGFEVYENEADLEETFKDIVKLKNLTSLTLAGCLPEGTSPEYLQTLVSSMPNLRRLDVRKNPLTGWFAELLGTASPLQYLNISQCGVSQIDLYFLANSHHIGQLEELDLSGTDLTALMEDVTQLLLQASGNLKWLGTAECSLGAHAQTVLDLLDKLPYLEEWDLNDNEFSEGDVCKIVEACAKASGFRFLKVTPPATVNSADPKEGAKEVRRFDGLLKAVLRRACADEDRKMRCLVTYKLPEYKDEPPTLI